MSYKEAVKNLAFLTAFLDAASNETTEILQTTNYYPFGMAWESSAAEPDPEHQYLYNGKELDTDFGLNWYHYGARMYDPAIGRFTSIDPLAETYSYQSPYNYADNNPVKFIDFMGLGSSYNWDSGRYEDEDGNEVSWDNVQSEHGIGDENGGGNNESGEDCCPGNDRKMDILIEQLADMSKEERMEFYETGLKLHKPWFDMALLGGGELLFGGKLLVGSTIARVGKTKKIISEVSLSKLNPLHSVPRPTVPQNHIQGLAKSIAENGYDINQAIPVLKLPNGKLVTAGGHHRVAAMKSLGEKTIPSRVVNWADLSTGAQARHLNAHYGKTLKNYLNGL